MSEKSAAWAGGFSNGYQEGMSDLARIINDGGDLLAVREWIACNSPAGTVASTPAPAAARAKHAPSNAAGYCRCGRTLEDCTTREDAPRD